jgi:hypothetical protein
VRMTFIGEVYGTTEDPESFVTEIYNAEEFESADECLQWLPIEQPLNIIHDAWRPASIIFR